MAIKAKLTNETNVVTGLVRFAFLNVFSPRNNDDGTPGKYDACILIDKKDKDTLAVIREAIDNATKKGLAEKWGGKLPKKFINPLYDGDEREDDQYDGFAGMYYINAKSKSRPGIVDKNLQKIFDEDEFYAGCFGAASLSFFPYDNNSKGVGVALNNLIKLKDGERFGGKPSAESDFEGFEGFEDDEDL